MSDEVFAVLKRLVEKRGHEAAQVTVTPEDTVQHCSPCPLDPEPSPDVCVKLESNEGRMDLGHPDSSVPRTRGRGIKDEPPPTAS